MMDEKIVLDALQGKESSFALIYEQTVERAHKEALRIVKDEHDAWDVVQDAYIKMWQSLDKLEDPSKLEPWFYKIVRNKALDFLGSKEVKHTITFSDIESASEDESFDYGAIQGTEYREFIPEEAVDYQETQRILWGLVNELPDKQRECMLLRWRENMKIKEISEATGYPEATVKSCLNYGRKKLEEALKKLEKEGTKLYGITPLFFLPFLRWMLGGESTVTATVSAANATATAAAAGTAAGVGVSASASAAAGAAASGVAKVGIGLTVKQIIAGVCAVAVIGTGVVLMSDRENEPKLPTLSFEETADIQDTAPAIHNATEQDSATAKTEPDEISEPPALQVSDFVQLHQEGSFKGTYNEISCKLPTFTINSPDAQAVNEKILQKYGHLLEKVALLKSEGETEPEDYSINKVEYRAWYRDGVVTLELTELYHNITRDIYATPTEYYSIYVDTGELVDSESIMLRLGMDETQFYENAAKLVEEDFVAETSSWDHYEDYYYPMIERLASREYLSKEATFYYDAEGNLMMTYSFHTLVGFSQILRSVKIG